MARGVGRRRGAEAKSGAAAQRRVAGQSWNCDGGDARDDSADDDGGARPMSGAEAAAAVAGLVRDRRGSQSEGVAPSETGAHVVAVAVELYNASAAAVAAAVVVAVVAVAVAVAVAAVAVAAVAVACATGIPSPVPSARSPLCRAHPARTWSRHDVRVLSLASSH
jgi:hypothetical protein